MTKTHGLVSAGLKSMTALPVIFMVSAGAYAAEVTLKSTDGKINLTGELVTFEDEHYVLDTDLGTLRVDSSRVACLGSACPVTELAENIEPSDFINLTGSETIANGLMPLLLEGYASEAEAASETATILGGLGMTANIVADDGYGDELGNFRVVGSLSSDAFANLIGNSAQVGLSSRRINQDEFQALRNAGAGNMLSPKQEHIVAVDSLVVITHPDNPIRRLSLDDLRGIYSGSISNWAQLGGADAPINVVQLMSGTGTKTTFDERVFGGLATGVPANSVGAPNSSAVAALVNEDKNAIGYVSYAFQRGAKPVTLVNECGIQVNPDPFFARTEEYPLTRFLYMYTRADTNDQNVDEFVEYATSPAADAVISKSGFIDLGVSSQSQALNTVRAQQLLTGDVDQFEASLMREMLGHMVRYDRLSSTFRFRTGSQQLTQRGEINLERLVEYVDDLPKGAKLMFVGFTDDVGAFQNNLRLANERASQVMSELRAMGGSKLDGIQMTAIGYGEVAPAACNTTEEGRAINRRVEVWIENNLL